MLKMKKQTYNVHTCTFYDIRVFKIGFEDIIQRNKHAFVLKDIWVKLFHIIIQRSRVGNLAHELYIHTVI